MWSSRLAAGLSVLLLAAIAASCKQKSGNERWPCPADGVIRAASGLCNCDVDGSALMISGWGKPCGACNSQDGNGRMCVCEDGALLTNDLVTCAPCPASCDGLQCAPPGCSLDCAPSCPGGTTCSAAGECIACQPGMCGGQCGSCPYGEVCLDGLCAPGNLCCLADNEGEHCSQGADFCVLPPGPFGPGTQCYCDVRAQDDLTYCTNRFYGVTVGPGQTCDSL